jgi:hypothetical protein
MRSLLIKNMSNTDGNTEENNTEENNTEENKY